MKKLIAIGFLLASQAAFASFPETMDSDISTMIRYAKAAVRDHAIHVVGMNPNYVKVQYGYSTGQFTAIDTQADCSFKATAKVSWKRLSTGHHWKVQEVPYTNTCR